MRRTDDLPRIRPFPVPTAWEPFRPHIELRLQHLDESPSARDVEREYGSTTLLEAAVKLFRSRLPLTYAVLPEESVERARAAIQTDLLGAPWVPDLGLYVFPYELDWPLARRGRSAPQRIRDRDRARLIDPGYDCGGFFTMYRTRAGVLRLCVGGRDPDECLDAWLDIARWLRDLRRAVRQHGRR